MEKKQELMTAARVQEINSGDKGTVCWLSSFLLTFLRRQP